MDRKNVSDISLNYELVRRGFECKYGHIIQYVLVRFMNEFIIVFIKTGKFRYKKTEQLCNITTYFMKVVIMGN